MASKRKLEEKRKRATQRRQEWEKELTQLVADRLLGHKPKRSPKGRGFFRLVGTEAPNGTP